MREHAIVPTYLQSVERAHRPLFVRVGLSVIGDSLPAGAESCGIFVASRLLLL